MAESVPTDVMKMMRRKIANMRVESERFKTESNEAMIKSELLRTEAILLEIIVDAWVEIFPETVE